MINNLQEKCGIFGVFGKGLDAARLTYFGLFALQHRGQDGSGISASDGKRIRTHKGVGLVSQVYSEENLETLKGHIAIGHNRYPTSGGILSYHNQPVAHSNDIVTLAHNGNLPTTTKLKKFCNENGIPIKRLNDSELMHAVIKWQLQNGLSLEDAIKTMFPLFTGAFSLLVMSRDKIAAVRDQYGIRPLSFGKLNDGYVFASETCALNTVSATYIRDVNPGEMVVVDKTGIQYYQLAKPNQKLDIFEFVYFSRPDSMLLGKSVYQVRKNLGRYLAEEFTTPSDVVIPVPDSSVPAAIGFSEKSGIPFDFGLTKNRYIGRTFIMPDQRLREKGVQMKLNPIREVVSGKRVILIDDSIVRGTTSQKLVKLLKDNGAKEVHFLSSCPPVLFPDFYGINTPTQKELIAANMSNLQMKKQFGADSVHFLSFKNLIRATQLPREVFCTSCFTGEYPIDIGRYKKYLRYPKQTSDPERHDETISSLYLQ